MELPAADKKSDYYADGHQTVLLPIDFLFQPIKAGSDPATLFRTITAGIDGASMPSFKGVMKDDDLWALSHYVKSLADLRGTPAAALAPRAAILKDQESAPQPAPPDNDR